MIYLASPYSHPDAAVRAERYDAACRATVALVRDGRVVFSPIVQGHPLVQYGLRGDWQFWAEFDRAVISRCDEVLVLQIDGWAESVGVNAEVALARELGIPVSYLGPYFPANPGV